VSAGSYFSREPSVPVSTLINICIYIERTPMVLVQGFLKKKL
jgi:hypothetical protein